MKSHFQLFVLTFAARPAASFFVPTPKIARVTTELYYTSENDDPRFAAMEGPRVVVVDGTKVNIGREIAVDDHSWAWSNLKSPFVSNGKDKSSPKAVNDAQLLNTTTQLVSPLPMHIMPTSTMPTPTPMEEEPPNLFDLWESNKTIAVQGGSLRTCKVHDSVDRVLVALKTQGRPLYANIELWQGPDSKPQTCAVYIENAAVRPFTAILETPSSLNTIALYNEKNIEFPMEACLETATSDAITPKRMSPDSARPIQGGSLVTVPLEPEIESVHIVLESDTGRPLNARIELLQGPNNAKQQMEVYCDDGRKRTFSVVIQTPGHGNVVRIANTSPIEFPLTSYVTPYIIDEFEDDHSESGDIMKWDSVH